MGLFKRLFGNQRLSRKEMRLNEPCRCGSGNKYRDCHWERDQEWLAQERAKLNDQIG
ncbi:MAG: SEC-C domain-containing protein [Actinobacteria bacterium]|nr:SEC-C domain-containing protein [Actinomycetota bacterium]